MAYKALYRTYRPSTFAEVAGQQHIVKTLKNALATNKIAHAYLFCGPRGTGKTSMAKLLAKSLNCEEGMGCQCNKCSNCQSIIDGSHPDVIEIDAASNNGVEEVRDLIDKVKYSPIKGKYKIYIIDEVHMMSPSAFNALLKTLEEPPEYVVFILATTEVHKILPTILSRCQRFDFSKVGDLDLKEKMISILKEESIQYQDEALNLIISLADGGVRDALSILDQTIAYSGQMVKEDDIEELFGVARIEEKIALISFIAQKDVKAIINKLDYLSSKGIDIKRLNNDLLDILKDLLVYQKTKDSTLLLKIKKAEVERLHNFLTSSEIVSFIDLLLETQANFRYVSNLKSLFEITLLKMTAIEDKTDVSAPKPKEKESSPSMKESPKETSQIKEEIIDDELPPWMKPRFEASVEPPTKLEEKKDVPSPKLEKTIEAKPSFINTSDIVVSPFSFEGEHNILDEQTIINMMVVGQKEERLALSEKWVQLKNFLADAEIGKYASLLLDGVPYVLCKEGLILQYDLDSLATRANIRANQKGLVAIVKKLLGREVFIYALPRGISITARTKYLNLYQAGKLPKAASINIDIKL